MREAPTGNVRNSESPLINWHMTIHHSQYISCEFVLTHKILGDIIDIYEEGKLDIFSKNLERKHCCSL